MSIVETIKNAIFFDKESGYNQTEIADKYNVRPQTISMLLNGVKKWGRLELATFEKMFPDAELILNKSICEKPADTVYTVGKIAPAEAPSAPTPKRSHFDNAMLEEWEKLDMEDKCRVMSFIAQLAKEKKSDSSATA